MLHFPFCAGHIHSHHSPENSKSPPQQWLSGWNPQTSASKTMRLCTHLLVYNFIVIWQKDRNSDAAHTLSLFHCSQHGWAWRSCPHAPCHLSNAYNHLSLEPSMKATSIFKGSKTMSVMTVNNITLNWFQKASLTRLTSSQPKKVQGIEYSPHCTMLQTIHSHHVALSNPRKTSQVHQGIGNF